MFENKGSPKKFSESMKYYSLPQSWENPERTSDRRKQNKLLGMWNGNVIVMQAFALATELATEL